MLCDFCHKQDAIIHIQEITPDGNKTINLCASCAMSRLSSLHPELGNSANLNMINELMGLFAGKDAKVRLENLFCGENKDQPQIANGECPGCHLTREELVKTHRLRCPQCAEAFYDYVRYCQEKENNELLPLATQPAPRRPRRKVRETTETQQQRQEVERLQRELDCAVKREDYKQAAIIRDRIAEYSSEQHSRKER